MTASVSAQEPANAEIPSTHAEGASAAQAAATTAENTPEASPAPARERGNGRRGGRDRRGGARHTHTNTPADGRAGAAPRVPARIHPVLEQLAALYPHLFGATFRPLKRGIFHDLQTAHPGVFEKEDLKAALGIHTRSTRYLQTVAAGEKRYDLAGQPVEPMAPEHVHHALLEVYRRKKARATEDLLPRLRNRIIAAFEASGLSREDYAALVRSRDESANAILQDAFAEWADRNARDEALLRAFEASGQTLEAFADMYGMAPRAVGQQLERARRIATLAASAPPATPSDSAPVTLAE